MAKQEVIIFTPFPFKVGQKIHIQSGSRKGDWEVVAVGEKKMTLRCPVSKREFVWDLFCFYQKTENWETWPIMD